MTKSKGSLKALQCPELFYLKNDMLLKMRGIFLVILELFSQGTLSQFLAYLDIACINSNEIHEQNKVFSMKCATKSILQKTLGKRF